MTDTNGRVEITLRDVWGALQQTGAQVSAVQGQLALLTQQVTERLDNTKVTLDDHEERLRSGEQTPKVSPEEFDKLEDRVGSLEESRGKTIGVGLALMGLTGVAAVLVEHAIH